jgi:hypothetical protein
MEVILNSQFALIFLCNGYISRDIIPLRKQKKVNIVQIKAPANCN